MEKLLGQFVRKWFGGTPSRPLGRATYSTVLLVLSLGYGVSGFYQLSPAESACVMRFGKFHHIRQSGLHWAAPGFDTVRIENTESLEVVKLSGLMLTQNENLVWVNGVAKYKIASIYDYLFHDAAPKETLRQAAESALRQAIGRSRLDDILTQGHERIAQSIFTELQSTLDLYQSGLQLQEIDMHSTKVPAEVQSAFDEVTKASQQKESKVNEAQAYAKKIVLLAQGNAQRILQEAQGYAEELTLKAEGQASKFTALVGEYKLAPSILQTRLYFDTLQSVLSKMPKVLLDDDKGKHMIYLPLERLMQGRNVQAEESLNEGRENPPVLSHIEGD